jgi:Flp pilus assembly CpaE family ATPase
VVPGDAQAELVGALELFSATTPTALLPYDREALDVALATGRSLGEARPSSPLRKAVGELAGRLVADVPAGADAAPLRAPRRWSGRIRG